MESEWRISHTWFAGECIIQVYRLRDVNKPDHSGNREILPKTFNSDEEAQSMCNTLNEEV